MAVATIELFANTGQTVTLDLYPDGSDTASFAAVAMTEKTNQKGLYSGTVTNPVAGFFDADVKYGGNHIGNFSGYIANAAARHRLMDPAIARAIYDVTGSIPNAIAAGAANGLALVGSNVGAAASVSAAVTVDTNNDKTGYALSATGLDQISVADPGATASITTFPKALVWLFRRFFKKTTLTATQLKTYADDGATVNVTQAVTDDGITQTQNSAT